MHASCYIPSMILVLSIPSIFLLLAAPSMASSFVSKPSLKLQEIANGMHNGLTQRRRHYTGAAPYNSVLGIHPGGSSAEQEGSPSLSDDTVPSTSSSSLSASEVTDSGDGTTSPPQDSSLGPNASEPGVLRRSFPSLPWHRLPNMLTYIRCLAIPALVGIFYLPDSYRGTNIATGVIFGLASATDWLDGYLARRWDISSSFGAFLDPVADKLMVSTSLILLAGRFGQVIAIPSLIILAREIAVSALREWMAQRGQRDVVKVGMQGKVKTAVTMVALTMLLLVPAPTVVDSPKFLLDLYKPAVALLYLSALVTVTSGSVYFRAAGAALLEK